MKTRYSVPILTAILLALAVALWQIPTERVVIAPVSIERPVPVAAPLNLRDTVHVVTVVSPDDGRILGNGSGVMVAPQQMLTAAHIIGYGPIMVGVEQAPAKVLKVDVKADIALLQVALGCPCAPIADAAPAVDAEAIAIGYPSFNFAATQILTTGRIQGYVPPNKRVVFSAPIAPGNSGGGLFVDGKLAGIVVELVGGGDGMFQSYLIFHLGLAVDTATMRNFYRSYEPLRVDPKLKESTGGRLS